jgi:glucuronate isomerase
MNKFLNEDFLLATNFARTLYHQYAENQPIIDYHNHLPPGEIASNRQFEDISSIWLAGDHYKWRAMRTLGIDEKFITGSASNKEKFNKWASAVPYTMRNPLYHWTHMELKRYFGIDKLLTPDTAEEVYKDCTAKLNTPDYSTRSLLKKMNVKVVCTTDDPADSLEHHKKFSTENIGLKMFPTFRPDKSYTIDNPTAYNTYLDNLSKVSGVEIKDYAALINALDKRMDFFHTLGCRLSDHGLEQIHAIENPTSTPEEIFKKVRKGESVDLSSRRYFQQCLLLELGRLYHKRGWTQQFHLGAIRNNNSRLLTTLGPDTGFDSVGDFPQSVGLSRFLNALDSTNQLTKTILYNLSPADNELMVTMAGNYNDGTTKGKMQFGSAWWFLDQKDGMEKQINTLSNLGVLSCFVGMLTDSRSFLSFPRHEYFRRILCNLIGNDVENGELPADEKWLGKMVSDICYNNANEYFNFQ